MKGSGNPALPFPALLRQSLYLYGITGAATALGFLTNLVFARYLPAETIGQYNFFLSILAVMGITALPSMGVTVVQAVAGGHEGNYARTLLLCLKSSLLGVAGICAVGFFFALHGATSIGWLLLGTALVFPLYALSSFCFNFLAGKKDFRQIALRTAVLAIAANISLSAAAYAGADTTTLAVLFLAIGIALNGPMTVRIYRLTKRMPTEEKAFSLGKGLQVGDAIQTIASYADAFVVSRFLGFTALGAYAVAKILPETLKGGAKIIAEVTFPHLMERDMDRRMVNGVFWKSVFLWLAVSAAYIALSPFVYPLLFPAYAETLFYSQLYSLSFVTFATPILKNALQSSFAKKQLNGINITSSVVGIGLLIWLTPAYGLTGAVTARVITRFLIFGMHVRSWNGPRTAR